MYEEHWLERSWHTPAQETALLRKLTSEAEHRAANLAMGNDTWSEKYAGNGMA
jgi:hypothetical protein